MHLEGPYRFNTTLTLTAKKIGKKGVADGSLYNMYIGTGGWNRTVTLDQAEEKGLVVCVGRVVSNFLGTRFSVIHDGLPAPGGNQDTKEREKGKEVACITYQPNLFGHKGPRRMTILAPFLDDLGQSVVSSSQSSLYDIFKSGQTDQLLTLQNKDPVWNEETESFVLNFNGRVTLASVKNFQIVSDKDLDFISLQFGRVSGDTFTMDMRAPFCPIQAFGIALSSLDTKLACE